MEFLYTVQLQRPADDDTWKNLHRPFEFVAKNSSEQAMRLEYIHQSGLYQTQLGLTWEKFCVRYAGIGSSHANSMIRRRQVFGEAYFLLTRFVGVSPSMYRKIASHVTVDGLEIDGHRVAFADYNSLEISLTLRRLQARIRKSAKARRRTTAPHSILLP